MNRSEANSSHKILFLDENVVFIKKGKNSKASKS